MFLVLSACLFEMVVSMPQASAPARLGQTFKIAHYNKLFLQSNHDDLVDWIKDEQPDILVIQEADAEALKRVSLIEEYPHQKSHIFTHSPFGLILISKYPIVSFHKGLLDNKKTDNPYFHAVVDIKGAHVSVYSAHPVPPVDYSYSKQRNKEIEEMGDMIASSHESSVIFLGDFNITPYSPYFKDMLKVSGLKNEYTSSMMPPTWPSGFLDYIFQIQIDHILHKGALDLIEKRRGPHLGSDHYSLIATYALR